MHFLNQNIIDKVVFSFFFFSFKEVLIFLSAPFAFLQKYFLLYRSRFRLAVSFLIVLPFMSRVIKAPLYNLFSGTLETNVAVEYNGYNLEIS